MEDAPTLSQVPKSVCPGMDTSSTVQVTKDLAEYSRASGSSGKELVLAPPYMCAVGQTVRKGSTTKRMGESTTLECLFVHRMQSLFFICIPGRHRNGREGTEIGAHVGSKIDDQVDLEKPTKTIDPVYLGCTQHECSPDSGLVEEYREMFESRISAGANEKWPDPRNVRKSDSVVLRRNGGTRTKMR